MINFLKYYQENKDTKPNSFKKGDKVVDTNPECKHYKSKGTVTKIKQIKDSKGNKVGNTVCYKCTNSGKRWDKNDSLEKTEIQLKKEN